MKFDQKDRNASMAVQFGRIDIDPGQSMQEISLDDVPLLITRNFVLFPGCTVSILLTRERALDVARMAQEKSSLIGVVCQLNADDDTPAVPDGLCRYGVMARVLQVMELPDGRNMAIVHSFDKFKIEGPGVNNGNPFDTVAVKPVRELAAKASMTKIEVTADLLKDAVKQIFSGNEEEPNELMLNLKQLADPVDAINLIATYAPIAPLAKMELLKPHRMFDRGTRLFAMLSEGIEAAKLRQQVREQTAAVLNDEQRRAFLRRQIDVIKDELEEGVDDDIRHLREAADAATMPEPVEQIFDKELTKLSRMGQQTPDYSVLYTYLETLTQLPWSNLSTVNEDFSEARNILDSDHFGLDKVKKRILEQIALIINKPDVKAPILCLVGAPGVGKTSLGASVARALGREYQRVSLGGVHDEAEIRGHRRTYIGAMPGRIMEAVKRAGTANPVLLLDEIDKLGQDIKGDPSAALLEVLDPEQNCHFHDNYINVDFDLSKVLFIATANTLSTLPRPLLDRMEVIELSGYLPQEKLEIARRHIIPRLLDSNGVSRDALNITDNAVTTVIERYTAESGVRQLEKSLAKIVRHFVLEHVSNGVTSADITPDSLKQILGVERYSKDKYDNNDYAGVATGLAWTEVGGEILFIETALTAAKQGGNLTLTGNLGNVMKESATIALQYIRAHASQLGVDATLFERYNIHLHVPEGATPKDGPSAGITMATSMISALTQKRVAERLAMTGELTLRGKVLPVGGIREKILAAKRAGITHILLSQDNRKDIEDIEQAYLQGVTFTYVDTMLDVARIAITDIPAKDALAL